MLRTNSKKAKINLVEYITKCYCGENYKLPEPKSFDEIAHNILDAFEREKYYSYQYAFRHNLTRQDVFEDWCRGLPSILDCGFCYARSAVKDLGDILEESDEERSRFTEEQTETMLIKLIYRTLISTLTSR